MKTHIALLRGINVSGQKSVKMDKLRTLCEKLGFKEVMTYVQSGNIVLKSPLSAPGVEKKLMAGIKKTFGFDVPVLVFSPADFSKVLKGSPYAKQKGVALDRLYVTFLAKPAPKAGLQKLGAISSGKDTFTAKGKFVYLHCPEGYGRSKLSNNVVEKALGLLATTRNWKTINELLEMSKS
ncbi:MAG: DUF1697 domain-containing protein [Bdellovibrionaceae bacterium]|nr:DUF1697 domain-containing protein [Bdellovibrionales bacterium]MCB9254210.1 DUF1697 domain-containing protein [Pseudobdellovibrionaceae bacterium]